MLKIRLTNLIKPPFHRSIGIESKRSLLIQWWHTINLNVLAIHMIAEQKVHVTLERRKSDEPSTFDCKQTTLPSINRNRCRVA